MKLTNGPGKSRDGHDSRTVVDVRLVTLWERRGGVLAVQVLAEWCSLQDTSSDTVEDGHDLLRQLCRGTMQRTHEEEDNVESDR